MSNGRILIAQDNRGLMELTAANVGRQANPPEVIVCEDGALLLTQFTRLARSGQGPRLCVVETELKGLTGVVAAYSMRAVERGLGHGPVPILFYTPEPASDEFKQLLSRVGRAVHLQRATDLPVEELARRLAIAIEKLLAQLGGR